MGSIGTQTLEVARELGIKISSLSAKNILPSVIFTVPYVCAF